MNFSLSELASRPSPLRSSPLKAAAVKVAALGLLTAVVGTGCVRIFTTTIPNPLKSGSVAKNNLSFKRRWRDREFSLPEGTFSHFASLTSLDATNVCFSVIMSGDGGRAREADPKSYTWRLSGSNEGISLNNATVTPEGAVERKVMAGEKDVVERTEDTVCPPGETDKTKCKTRQKSTTKRVASDITVLRGRATGCFAHGGKITTSTSHIMLSLNSVNFKWNLQ